MKTFIPHKDNPYVGRQIAGTLVITLFSIVLAYYAGNYSKEYAGKANANALEVQKTEKVEFLEKETKSGIPNAEGKIQNEEDKVKPAENEKVLTVNESNALAITLQEAKTPIPVVRSKDPKTKLEEAKIFTKPLMNEGKYIDISLAHQNMVLFENGRFVDAYLVSSGKKGMDTPIGNFKIENKTPRAWSKKYGLYMPNWMAIEPSGKYGIHELPEWPGGYKEGASHLGVPVSHGCVRLGEGPAKRVYDWAEVGTSVIIHK